MSVLTWDEFKAKVDEELETRAMDGSTPIWYIDITYPGTGGEVLIVIENNELVIT